MKRYLEYSRYANLAFSFGTTMVASMLLGYFGGNWLDRKLGTFPWLMVVGLLLGVAVSFYNLFTEIKVFQEVTAKQAQDREPSPDETSKEKDIFH